MSRNSEHHHRSAKNYLLDPAFQLKYTGILVGATSLISAGLGTLLWSTTDVLVEQAQVATRQGSLTVEKGRATVDRGKEVLAQSNKVNQVVTSTIETCYGDNPELLKAFRAEAAKDDDRLRREQSLLENDTALLTSRAEELARNSVAIEGRLRATRVGLIVALVSLVLLMAAAGVVVTHRVAGPIHKMKRLLAGVGDGQLVVREKLRKGDELVHFFEAFERMVESLRARREREVAELETVLAALDASMPAATRERLELLRDELKSQVP